MQIGRGGIDLVTKRQRGAPELPSSDVLRRLNETDWTRILPKLVAYAQLKLESITWMSGHVPGGTEAEDLAHEAIESLFIGLRNWNMVRHPDIEVVLKGIVKSLVNHLAQNKDNRTRQASSENEGEDGWGHEALSNEPSPDERAAINDLIARIDSLLDGDEDAGLVFLGLQEGAKPREIAEDLEIPITRIYADMRRIRRKVQGLRTEVTSRGADLI